MFFLFATLSALGYALQQVFLTKYARQMDGLSVTIYRNTSFIVTMLPFLLFVPSQDFSKIPDFLPAILGAGLFGAIYLALQFLSYRYIAIGISSALQRSTQVIFSIILGFFFFHESLSLLQMLCILFIIIGVLYLAFIKNALVHLDNNMVKGMVLSLFPGILLAVSYFFMSEVSRGIHPFIAGYFWEISIGILALFMGIIRYFITGQGIHRINLKMYGEIALAASPTLIGTGFVAFAVKMGPLGLAQGIGILSVVFAGIFAHYWYNERLNAQQWLAIAIISIAILLLQVIDS